VGNLGDYSSGTVRDLHPVPFSGIPIANGIHTVDKAKVIQLLSIMQVKDANKECS
jgi:hypothetical protein